MSESTVSVALEREHAEIDDWLAAFAQNPTDVAREDLVRAAQLLRRHIYIEEAFMFPPLLAAGIVPPVFVMQREHGEIWRLLDALEHHSPASVDTTRELLAVLANHNSKEEPIIYPQAEVVLSDEAKQEILDFVTDGAMPNDWVCAMGTPTP